MSREYVPEQIRSCTYNVCACRCLVWARSLEQETPPNPSRCTRVEPEQKSVYDNTGIVVIEMYLTALYFRVTLSQGAAVGRDGMFEGQP